MKGTYPRRSRFQGVAKVRRQPVQGRVDVITGYGKRIHAVGCKIVEPRRQLQNGGVPARTDIGEDGCHRIADIDRHLALRGK